jgi:glycogen phosphorylase
VAAGFDRFTSALIEQYLRTYAEDRLGITLQELLALGRLHVDDASEPFNMAYLAIRGSRAVNGVNRLHGQVSRHIFQSLFPPWPAGEVSVGHVTNGMHTPSWDPAEADEVWTVACQKDRWRGTMETLEEDLRAVPDAKLWHMRCAARQSLTASARERLAQQLAGSGASPAEVSYVDPG